jgi:hypothetical protein
MGVLGRFLTGDVLDGAELEQARADGIVLHVRKLKAAIAYDHYRAPGQRFNGKRLRSSGGALVTTNRVVLWAGGVRQLDLQRSSLPSPVLEVSADADVLRVAFAAENFHADRSGSVEVRLWTPEAQRLVELLTR